MCFRQVRGMLPEPSWSSIHTVQCNVISVVAVGNTTIVLVRLSLRSIFSVMSPTGMTMAPFKIRLYLSKGVKELRAVPLHELSQRN